LADLHREPEALGKEVQVIGRDVGEGTEPGEESLNRHSCAAVAGSNDAGQPRSFTGYMQIVFHVTTHYWSSMASCIA
jgi:hypothetical protein